MIELDKNVRAGPRWGAAFDLDVGRNSIRLRGSNELALLKGCLFVTNYWRLRGMPVLPIGSRRVEPAIPVHIGADLWGGFSTTQAWINGREEDTNFLELARVGVDAVPIMTLLEDYIEETSDARFSSLINPRARSNRRRLAKLARNMSRCGVFPMLMAYNPKLDPKDKIFSRNAAFRGSLQGGGAFRVLCSSNPDVRKFLAEQWASLFREIPELAGMMMIIGGEGFWHCHMRSRDVFDCRCGKRKPSSVVAELVNDISRAVHRERADALMVAWTYSAFIWSKDLHQSQLIESLDPKHVIFQTEIDKDSIHWRPAGYAKYIWDYSMSYDGISERCLQQRRLSRARDLRFSCKIECNTSIECLNVPYLPVVQRQQKMWENSRSLKPYAIHSRWLFDGSCKSIPEEIGYWSIWGKGTEFASLSRVRDAIAKREFGDAAPHVLKAWHCFSEAIGHHPCLDYYFGPYFIGPGQPLVLSTKPKPEEIGREFYGIFYWKWEMSATHDTTFFTQADPLFYSNPAFQVIARRGPRKGQDVGLLELQAMAELWEKGAGELEKARAKISRRQRARFEQEYVLGKHLAYTWRSAANVEEFLRRRELVRRFSYNCPERNGYIKENMAELDRMSEIAREELRIAQADLKLIQGASYLDNSLRLDVEAASATDVLRAKIRQVQRLLKTDLPAWRKELRQW